MRLFFTWVVGSILAITAVIGISFALNYAGFVQWSFFAPRVAAVQNRVFQQSPAYTQGQIQDLQNMRIAYIQAHSDAARSAIAGTVAQRFADVNRTDWSASDKAFYAAMLKIREGVAQPVASAALSQ